MAELTHGGVTVRLPDDLIVPAAAGTLSPLEVSRVAKAPRGLGAACEDAAEALEKAGAAFVAPLDVTPERLRRAGSAAERIDGVIASLEFLVLKLKQANLLLDGEAWELVRKVNDVVLAQGKTNPEILALFAPTRQYMQRFKGAPKPPTEG